MSDKPSRILVLLLGLVPMIPGMIRRREATAGLYDTVLSVIEEYGTDEQREWSDLAQIIRQEKALLKAAQAVAKLGNAGSAPAAMRAA